MCIRDSLQPVLDILSYIHHETDCWLEITTLLIPGQNDSPAEIKALSEWVARELGANVPVHFTAFHPDWKMGDLPPTPPSSLTRAPVSYTHLDVYKRQAL